MDQLFKDNLHRTGRSRPKRSYLCFCLIWWFVQFDSLTSCTKARFPLSTSATYRLAHVWFHWMKRPLSKPFPRLERSTSLYLPFMWATRWLSVPRIVTLWKHWLYATTTTTTALLLLRLLVCRSFCFTNTTSTTSGSCGGRLTTAFNTPLLNVWLLEAADS